MTPSTNPANHSSTSSHFPPLDLTFVRQQLAHSAIGHTLVYHTTIPSTMPIATELAKEAGTPSGLIVVAEEQSSGRGRQGRTWRAPYASALLVSMILKPPHTHFPAATLTMKAGNALLAAVAATVPELASDLYLKWPNDLVIGNDPATARKVAGILAESSLTPVAATQESTIAYAILGIGINVNQKTSDLPRIAPPTPPATSLRVAANNIGRSQNKGNPDAPDRLIDRSYLLVHLCQHLAEELTVTSAESYRRWKSHLATLGHQVAVYTQGLEQPPALSGQAVDVQEDGALVVEDAAGQQHIFYAADVSVRTV